MYYDGDGVAQDYGEAVKWFQLAADRGDRAAQNNLGLMYAQGQGVPQNHVQAFKWFNLSARAAHERRRDRRSAATGERLEAEALVWRI